VLIFSLFKIQIMEGEHYRKISEDNRIRLIPIRSTRGRILDANNLIIADNIPSFNLHIIPDDFFIEDCQRLSAIIDIPADVLKNKIKKSSQPSFVPVKVKEDLTQNEIHILEERNQDFSGVFITITGKRYYPYGEIASQIVGYLGKISRDEYQKRKQSGYLIDDYVGRAGIERIFDRILHGIHGGKQIEVNARGQEMQVLAIKHPVRGEDIHLTMNIELQSRIHQLVKDEHASVCLMNIKTGEIVSLVSTPAYDPNAFVTPSRSSERLVLLRNKALPFLNRGISSPYPPGSVFKLVTALAALEAGKITPRTSFECTGAYKLNQTSREFHCWSKYGHGTIALESALQQSCNVYFYKVGRLVGADGIEQFAKKIGFIKPFTLELPHVRQGILPSTKWKRDHLKEKWYQGETMHYSIGQGFVSVTPIQILRLIALIASNGTIVDPTIIKGIQHPFETVTMNRANIRAVKQGMLKAVDTLQGTAHVAKVDFFKVAGKTGTAETVGEPHSWFAGFFPYNDPHVALVVVIEHGGTGGGKAATVANSVARMWHETYNGEK